jgi:hypothetical protein
MAKSQWCHSATVLDCNSRCRKVAGASVPLEMLASQQLGVTEDYLLGQTDLEVSPLQLCPETIDVLKGYFENLQERLYQTQALARTISLAMYEDVAEFVNAADNSRMRDQIDDLLSLHGTLLRELIAAHDIAETGYCSILKALRSSASKREV